MLESLVASILNRVLGSYVENFDPKQLRIGLLSGDVKLGNLKLKRGALDQLQLPIDVIDGHIGNLILQIPYSNLKSKPVKVLIEDVFLMAKPDAVHNEEGIKRREQAAKMHKLELWEVSSERAVVRTQGTGGASTDTEENRAKQQQFTSSLVTKIIENLQVTVRNIHIRYEDSAVGVAMGATLGELSAVSANSDWDPAFIADVGPTTRKLATLDSLAFYMDPDSTEQFCVTKEDEEQRQKLLDDFKAVIFDSVGANDILRPINGQGFITINKLPESDSVPRIKADLKFEELSITLDREQYVDTLRLLDRIQRYNRTVKYRKYRPKVSVKEDPKAWLRYAGLTVLEKVREKRRVWSWEYIKKRINDEKRYIELYKLWYRDGGNPQALSVEERETFNKIQDEYSYDDLVLFRSVAKRILLSEPAKPKPAKREEQTWSQWLWGSTPDDAAKEAAEAANSGISDAPPLELTSEQRQELLDVLDTPTVGDESVSQVMLNLEFSLRSAGLRLKSGDTPLASAGFDGVKLDLIQRQDSFSVEMGVSSVAVTDLTKVSQFSNIISVQAAKNGDVDNRFFWFLFEHHPLDGKADSNLFLKAKSIAFVHNARLIESITRFFAVPPDQGDTVDVIINAANRTVDELREQTRIGLEYALNNHKTLNLKVDMKAPTIVVPLDALSKDTAAVVLDVGSLSIESDLVPQNVLEEVRSKQALKYTKQDWKRLESLMYDRLTITLRDTQLLLGEHISDIEASLKHDSSRLHFLDKSTLQFLLELSIVPQNRGLTRSRLSIKLPNLRATLSDVQYQLFMRIMKAAAPRPINTQLPDSASESSLFSQDEASALSPEEQPNSVTESKHTIQGTEELEKHAAPQRTFELVFVVDQVEFLVVRGWNSQPLFDMCLHELRMNYWITDGKSDEIMAMDLNIGDLLLTDHLDSSAPADLRKIVESEGHAGDRSSSTSPLFALEYRQAESGDKNVAVSLAAMRFSLNPTTVLAIYDYVMSTFTSHPDEASPPPLPARKADTVDQQAQGDARNISPPAPPSTESTTIKVQMKMNSVMAVLVDDSQVMATLSMDQATLNIDLKDALKFQCVLGHVHLVDSQSTDVLTIEGGGNLVDLRYETKPMLEDNITPSGPSLIYLRMGMLKLSVLEQPLTQLSRFLTRFTAMKAVYDQARMMAFNQAIQVEPGMFLFDVIVSAPIIMWPRGSDWIQFNLGEIFVKNKFEGTQNLLQSGVRKVQVLSSINKKQGEIVPKLDFTIDLTYTPDSNKKDESIMLVQSGFSPIHIHLSEHQYQYVMLFLASIARIKAGTASSGLDANEMGNLRSHLAKEKHIEKGKTSYWWGDNFSKALSSDKSDSLDSRPKLTLGFNVPVVDLTLEFEDSPLSRFAMRETIIDLEVDSKSDSAVNFHIDTFMAEDLSGSNNHFKQIIPPIKHIGQHQVLGRLIQRESQPIQIELSVDSPQVILAPDYLLDLKRFLDSGKADESEAELSSDDESSDSTSDTESLALSEPNSDSDASRSQHGSISVKPLNQGSLEVPTDSQYPHISINVVDMYLTFIADASNENSEAVVFKMEHLILNTSETLSLSVSKTGMFLTRMQTFDAGRLRILDDFNVTCSIDNAESTENLKLANIQFTVEPLVLRISLREILLILDMTQRISSVISSDAARKSKPHHRPKKATNFFVDDHRIAKPSSRTISGDGRPYSDDRDSDSEDENGMRALRVLSEQLTAHFEGFRLVLIDPVYQLPLTDLCVKPFTVVAKNWSDSLVINAKAELIANVHSFTKSAWEPLVDTMEIGLTVTGDAVEVYSDSVADLELTPETLSLVQDVQDYFSGSPNATFQRDRHEEGSPYRIRNETGVPITVWADVGTNTRASRRRISDGEEIKWSFQDSSQLRENLNAMDQDALIGVEFDQNEYDALRSIPVNRVGEQVYVLQNKDTQDRILLDIWVEDHLKFVTIRSTCVINNVTDTELQVKLVGTEASHSTFVLAPHSTKPVPVKHIDSRILLKRTSDSQWGASSVYWKDLSEHGSQSFQCSEDFFLSVIPTIPDVPLSKVYPYLSINLTAPFQLVNNLPQNVGFRLYSRDGRRESEGGMNSAGRSFIHEYNKDTLLLLRVEVPGYNCNKFAVINTGHRYNREFHIEESLEISQGHQRLYLRLEYIDLADGKGRVIVIYSPFVVINSSGKALMIAERLNRVMCEPGTATIWSFNNIQDTPSHRVTISADTSYPSAPVPISATGTSFEVALVSKDRRNELYLGGKVIQGSGRYINTKVITLSPRFILWNAFDRTIEFHEPGGDARIVVNPGERAPVGFISSLADKEMCGRFADSADAEWSSSFPMSNVGSTFVRFAERGKSTVLIQVEVILESATLFVRLTKSDVWPYSIRNFTDHEFRFYQSDPFVDSDGDLIDAKASSRFTPIVYRLPAKSAMPYSWDFPSAALKQIVLEPAHPASSSASVLSAADDDMDGRLSSSASVYGDTTSLAPQRRPRARHVKRRNIQLAEIGELPPANFGDGKIVDLSVIADGPQQALVVAPYSSESSTYDARTNTVKAEAIADVEALEAHTGRVYKLNLKGIGISCISPQGYELLYLTLRNLKASYSFSDALETISLQIQWIQIDNTMPGSTDFPVVVYPTVLPKAADELAKHPCFSASMTRVVDDSYGLTYIKHATLLLQEMTIEADEDFLLGVADLIIAQTNPSTMNPGHSNYVPIVDDNSQLCAGTIHIPEPSGNTAPDIYFEQLHLQPIQINLSFLRTGSLTTSAIFKDKAAAGNLAFLIDAVTMTLGNINDAPLKFNALLVDNVRTQVSNLMSMIQTHYQQELIYQLHKVVGSADIIGNPVGLFNNISSGVVDLFYEPYLGYTLNDRPQEFGVGLAKGGLSFMKKSVYGLSDSISKVTGSLSKGLTAMTLDPRYQRQQRARRTRNRPRHAIYGFKYGFESFYESMSSGITGLAEAPMQGALTDGGVGFFRGLGVGLLGLPTKTTIGLLDLASNVTEGIRNTTTVFDAHAISRVRLPRVIATDGVVRPYNVRESVGQMILHSVKEGRYSKDKYLAHSNITQGKVVVVSLERVLVASLDGMQLEWALTYDQVESVTMERTGIVITLLGDVRGPFIPLSDEDTRRYIYKNIAKGTEAYNHKRLTIY